MKRTILANVVPTQWIRKIHAESDAVYGRL